jgi:excisionase family DNA binding protein
MMNSHSESELLTVEQFAQRLQVSRTTVFSWLKNGDIREGVHYLRIGRVLRFHWPFFPVSGPSLQTDGNVECKSTASARLQKKRCLGKVKLQHGVDGSAMRYAREVFK